MTKSAHASATRASLTAAVAVLAAVSCSLLAPLVVAVRTDNGFMIGAVTVAMLLMLVGEGVFLGRLISMNNRAPKR